LPSFDLRLIWPTCKASTMTCKRLQEPLQDTQF
jgi:hypothetical protein